MNISPSPVDISPFKQRCDQLHRVLDKISPSELRDFASKSKIHRREDWGLIDTERDNDSGKSL